MAFDVQKWLTDEMGFSAEEATTLAPQFSSRTDKLEKGILRQSDYSRKMDDLRKLEGQLAENNEKLNADLAEFASMTAGEQGEATKLRERIEKAEETAFKLTQKITRYGEANGIDVKEILGDVDPPKKTEPVAFDDKQLRLDVRDQIGGVAGYMLELTAALPDIAAEHERLTGTRFNQREFIAGIKADIAAKKLDNLDPVKRWEAANNIPTLRTEAATKHTEASLAAAREEGRMAGLSERALPGEGRPGEHAPVFKMGGESKLQRPQPGDRLSGAVSALATGRYRGEQGRKAS